MLKQQTQDVYQSKVQEAIAFIYQNLDRPFSFEDVADHVNLSPFHFHRIFRHQAGETLSQAQKRLRLQRAAFDLLKSDKPISDIAKQATFSDTSTFTRAFQDLYGLPPAAYRTDGKEREFSIQQDPQLSKDLYDVEIVTLENLVFTTLDHKGHYMEIGEKFDRLTSSIPKEAFNDSLQVWGIYYDDPGSVAAEDLRSQAAITTPREEIPLSDVKTTVIKGGRFAKLLYKGPYNELDVPYRWLYENWFLNSGEMVRDEPCIEQYINSPHENAPKDLLTEIYLPLA